MRCRIRRREAGAGDVELGLRLLQGRAWRETAEDRDGRARARAQRGPVHAERYPDPFIAGEPEGVRHHADDRRGRRAHVHRSSQDVRCAVEARSPHRLADDHHQRLARRLVLRREHAAQEWDRSHHPERAGGNLRARYGFHSPVLGREVALEHHGGAEVRDGLQPASPGCEVVQRTRLRAGRPRVPVDDRHHGGGIPNRQSRVQPLVQGFEVHGAERDPDRERQGANDGEPRVPHQHAEPDLEVQPGKAHGRHDYTLYCKVL